MTARRRRSTWRSRGVPLVVLTTFALVLAVLETSAVAQPAGPRFIVEAYNDFVHVYGWTSPSAITISIDDPSTGAGVDYTKTETGPADTGFLIHFWDEYDVQPGHVVEVTDGTTTLAHTVRDVVITELDPEADRVAGTADPGSTIALNIGGPEPIPVPLTTTVTADTLGNWVAELAPYDLLHGAWTSAIRIGPNFNATSFTLNPTFIVPIHGNFIHTWGWLPGLEITLTIDDPATGPDPDFTSTATSPAKGQALSFNLDGAFDVQPGHAVTLTDGISNVAHTVRTLSIDHANSYTGWITGSADPGSAVVLESWQNEFPAVEVLADASGNWAVGPLPLDVTDGVRAQVRDIVWNSTQTDRHVSNPHVVMFYGAWGYPELEMWTTNVNGFQWGPGSIVTLEIDDPATPELEYTAVTAVDENEDAYFELFGTFGGTFEVEAGWLVTLFDDQEPQTIKSHEVDYLTVETIDRDTDSLTGFAGPGAELHVRVIDPSLPFPEGDDRFVTADQTGQWATSFAVTTDIDFGSNGWVISPMDDDGDKTQVNWYLISPPDLIEVEIDIKPGTYVNPINVTSNGVIPVAILTTEDFDATSVAPMSVAFGPAGANEAHGRGHLVDLGDDGDTDLMLHFRTQETGIQPGDTEVCLTAETLEGQAITGCDLITTS